MQAHGKRSGRSGFTLIELLVVISVIIILATVAITALVGVMGQQQVKNAEAFLKILDSSISSYHKLYGHWPLEMTYQPPLQSEAGDNALVNDELNENILKQLKHDWGQGNFSSFSPDAVKIGVSGNEQFVDPYGRPYQFKVKVVKKGGKDVITAIYFYSMGVDGQDDFPDLQAWLALPGSSWPPSDKYQEDLRTGNPGSFNLDNIYPETD